MTLLNRSAAFLAAAGVATLLGTVLQTQFNLAALAGLGAAVPFATRMQVTLQDLAGFAPTLGALMAAGFLVAFLATGVLRRWITARRTALYMLAGAVAMLAMLLIMKAVLGITAIAAARGPGGFATLLACGAIGGWIFARLTSDRG